MPNGTSGGGVLRGSARPVTDLKMERGLPLSKNRCWQQTGKCRLKGKALVVNDLLKGNDTLSGMEMGDERM